jgi:hypothetical protein
MATISYNGPVDYAVFSVPKGTQLTDALRALILRVDSGAIELLGLEVIERDAFGAPVRQPITVLSSSEDLDLSVFHGTELAILDDEDSALIAAELNNDSRALVIVYEDRSLAAVAERVGTAGGQLLWSGGVEVEDLDEKEDAPQLESA